VNISQLLGDNTASFLFCIPLPNKYLCDVFINLITQPIRLWNNAYLIQEAFVFLDSTQITPEKVKSSYFENFSNKLDLSYLSIQELVIRSVQQLFYYAYTSQLDIYELPSELVLIFDQRTDINSRDIDVVENRIKINTNELLSTVKLALYSSNYSINNICIWFTNKSYLPSSAKYSLDNLSLYLVQGFDNNLINAFFFSKSREFSVKDFIISKIKDLHIETVVKPYF
jgi:hypothetical protein